MRFYKKKRALALFFLLKLCKIIEYNVYDRFIPNC